MLKNIVIVCDYAYVEGGAASVAIDTALTLSERGLNVYFFAGSGQPDERLSHAKNIKVITAGIDDILHDKNRLRAMLKGIYNFSAGKSFRELLSSLDKSETVIHIHTWTKVLSSSVFREAFKAGFRVFLTLHDYFTVCPNGGCYNYKSGKICEIPPMSLKCFVCNCDSRRYLHKIWRVMRQFVQNRVIRKNPDMVYIFISEFSRKQLLRRMSTPKRQFLVPNPAISAGRFRVEAEKNSLFLFIGRLSKEKGIEDFCRAVHASGVQGVAVGDGALRAGLEVNYPEITFTGWLDKSQILEWLKKARCLVFPSRWYEVSPLVPPEANAYGIPVIASDCTAASDNAAFVYHSQNELEEIMRRVNVQDIKQLSIDTYNNFHGVSFEEYASRLLEVYSSMSAE